MERNLKFLKRLSGDSQPLTYVTLLQRCEGESISLYFNCFEKYPDPSWYFPGNIGGVEFSFSHADCSLADGCELRRDGGENLEGVFWGAKLTIPKKLIKTINGKATLSLSYVRGETISSPFEDGEEEIEIG